MTTTTTPTGDVLAQIRASLPNYSETAEQLELVKAEQARRFRAAQASSRGSFESVGRFELLTMLEAGESLDQLDERIAARQAADDAAGQASAALATVRDLLQANLKVITDDPAHVLPRLGARMSQLVDEAKNLEPLAEIATQDAAFSSKRFDDATRLAEIVAEIVALRREQARVLRESGFEWTSKLAVLQAIRNPGKVFDDVAVWLRPGYLIHRTRNEQRAIETPWPWPIHMAMATPEFVLWCLQSGAEQWIPSPAAYDKEAAELRKLSQQPRTDRGAGDWRDPGPERITTSSRTHNRGRS